MRDQEVVRLVARRRHRRRDVGPEEQVGREGAEEHGAARSPRSRRFPGEPGPEPAQEDRRLHPDEEHVPGADHGAPGALPLEREKHRGQPDHQDERRRLVDDEAAPEDAAAVRPVQPRVGREEDELAGGDPEREQSGPGEGIGTVPLQTRRECAGREAGAPPQPPEADAGEDGEQGGEEDLGPTDRRAPRRRELVHVLRHEQLARRHVGRRTAGSAAPRRRSPAALR